MGLIDAIKAKDKKGLFNSDDTFINYSTGLLPLDYANGFWYEVEDEKTGEKKHIPITGVIGGTFITIVGTTGSGKTTLADFIGYSIIKRFEDGYMAHIDTERTALKPRICKITGADPEDPRISLHKSNVYIEDVLKMIDAIAEEKEAGGDMYRYEVKGKSYNGKPYKVYVPTVFIIDSLVSFYRKDANTEDLGTNMDGAREAKDIANFYNKCLANMQKYNITIICVNHLTPKVEADRFAAPPAGLIMLRPGESIPRGLRPLYMSQNVFRCNAIKSNMYTKDDVGFDGFKITIQVAKSKTAFIGSSIDAAFNEATGFDPVYTMFEFASSLGLIQGRNPYLYLQGLESFKFSRKDFRRKFGEEDEFRHAFMETIQPYLESLLGNKELSKEDEIRYNSIDLFLENDDGSISVDPSKLTKKGKLKE